MNPLHPVQPVVIDARGVARFKANAIIQILFNTGVLDLNAIAYLSFSEDDRAQLAQLVGYSVSDAADLSYMPANIIAAAELRAATLLGKKWEGN